MPAKQDVHIFCLLARHLGYQEALLVLLLLKVKSNFKWVLQVNINWSIFIDIIEEIIAEEIVDEFDRYEDNQSKNVARRRTTAAIMRG